MSKQKVEVEVDVPDGFELTGEHRPCKEGDYFIDPGNPAMRGPRLAVQSSAGYHHLIIRRKLSTALQACKLLYDSMQPGDAEYRQATCLAAAALREAGVLK